MDILNAGIPVFISSLYSACLSSFIYISFFVLGNFREFLFSTLNKKNTFNFQLKTKTLVLLFMFRSRYSMIVDYRAYEDVWLCLVLTQLCCIVRLCRFINKSVDKIDIRLMCEPAGQVYCFVNELDVFTVYVHCEACGWCVVCGYCVYGQSFFFQSEVRGQSFCSASEQCTNGVFFVSGSLRSLWTVCCLLSVRVC